MKTSCGKFLNLAHYFPYDVKLRLLAHSRSFLPNQKARYAIVGADENLLNQNIVSMSCKIILRVDNQIAPVCEAGRMTLKQDFKVYMRRMV